MHPTIPEDRSPVLALRDAIAASPFNVAPERALSLPTVAPHFALALSNDRKFNVRVNTETHEATLPIATLEYMWACTHLLLGLYEAFEGGQHQGDQVLDLGNDRDFCTRLDLFNWALNNMLDDGQRSWPADAARPADGVQSLTDELFLVAIGWILHHEIAHVRSNHQRAHRLYTVQQESEADAKAVDWIFGACTDPQMLTKRQLGMTIALLAMQFLDEPTNGDTYIGTHPPTSERIFVCLNRAQTDPDGLAYSLCSIAMHFQLGQHALTSGLDGPSFQAILDEALVTFRTSRRGAHYRR